MGWYEQLDSECGREETAESGGTLLAEETPMVVQSRYTLREHLRVLMARVYWRTTLILTGSLALIGTVLYLLVRP